MTTTSTITSEADGASPAITEGSVKAISPVYDIVRDIARGGLAGIIVGLVVVGVGGRLVMRIAALRVPSATGAFTENGNRIGDITLDGSLALIVFVGLFGAVFLGVVWVVISPWLPGTGLVKGLVAMPIAVAFGAVGLIEGRNPDFFVLDHDPLVVAVLIALVALVAPAMALVDGWLDRRLPKATSRDSGAALGYLILTLVGGLMGGVLMLQSLGNPQSQPIGVTVVIVGFVTLAWWFQRSRGRQTPPTSLVVLARTILLVGTVWGFVVLLPEVNEALGLR